MSKTTTKATLATKGLDVTREAGLVLVSDGQTQWLCEETAYDAAVESLSSETVELDGMDAVDRQELEADAYAELCDRVAGPVVSNGGNGQGEPEEKASLVRRAVAAGMLAEDDSLVQRYAA